MISTLIICLWAPNQHIRVISEVSCDTEDWNNGCWKFSFALRNKLHFKIHYIYTLIFKKNIFYCINIYQYYCFYCIFCNIAEHLRLSNFLKKIVPKTFKLVCTVCVSVPNAYHFYKKKNSKVYILIDTLTKYNFKTWNIYIFLLNMSHPNIICEWAAWTLCKTSPNVPWK